MQSSQYICKYLHVNVRVCASTKRREQQKQQLPRAARLNEPRAKERNETKVKAQTQSFSFTLEGSEA